MARKKKPPRRYIRPPPVADAPFVDAILAAPDDDAPRLVYADHLLEHGDAVHGELITVQCTRARLERDDAMMTAEYRAAREREDELRAVFSDAWLRTFGSRGIEGEWRRGFVARIRGVSPRGLREHVPLVSRHPVERIDTFDARGLLHYPTVTELHEVGRAVGTLKTIDVRGWHGSAELSPFDATADAPALSEETGVPHESLRDAVVAFRHPHPTEENLAAFAKADLPALRRYELSKNVTFPADAPLVALEALMRSPALSGLEELVSFNLSPSAACVLIAHARPGLRALAVSFHEGWRVEPALPRELARCPALSTLEDIIISGGCDEDLVATLAERALRLESLNVSHVTAKALVLLAAEPLASRWRKLHLAGTHDRTLSAAPLAAARFPRLRDLELSHFRVEEDFAASPALDRVARLRFSVCEMTPETKSAIVRRWPGAIFWEP